MKKGSLNLSIQAIVIIVIAFVVLGLGLTFVRSQFKSMGETAGAVQEQISQQILEDLRTGNKKLSFPTEEVKVNGGESKGLAIGVKNTGEAPLEFKLVLAIIDDVTGEEKGLGNKQEVDVVEGGTTYTLGKFIWNPASQKLGVGESNVYPVKFLAGHHSGTYTFVVKIMDTKGTPDTSDDEAYASKSFFITIL